MIRNTKVTDPVLHGKPTLEVLIQTNQPEVSLRHEKSVDIHGLTIVKPVDRY